MGNEGKMSSAGANGSVGATPHVRIGLCDPWGSLPTQNIL